MLYQPVAEVQVAIKFADRDLKLTFNANTMVAYEQLTKRFFLDTMSNLLTVMFPNGAGSPPMENPVLLLRKVSMTDLRAILWAALHEYNERDEPVWPMSVYEVGRHLSFSNIIPIFTAFMQGQIANSPTKSEMGESQAAGQNTPSDPPQNTQERGGERGIELPVDAFV